MKGSLDRVEAEARSAKESLSRAVDDFRGSDRYWEELLETGFASYRVGYEDGRDAVQTLYLELDLSGVIPPGAEDQATEEMADPSSGDTVAVEEIVPEQIIEGETVPTPDPAPTIDPAPTFDLAPTLDPAATVDPTSTVGGAAITTISSDCSSVGMTALFTRIVVLMRSSMPAWVRGWYVSLSSRSV